MSGDGASRAGGGQSADSPSLIGTSRVGGIFWASLLKTGQGLITHPRSGMRNGVRAAGGQMWRVGDSD